jgi:hypothetical protein
MMDDFMMGDITPQAKQLANPPGPAPKPADWKTGRHLYSQGFTSYPKGSGTEKLDVSDTGFIIIGDERIDVRALHDVATPAQVDALAFLLLYLVRNTREGSELEQMALAMRGLSAKGVGKKIDAADMVNKLYEKIEAEGLDAVDTGFFVSMKRFLDLPRVYELRAAINRMRNVEWR